MWPDCVEIIAEQVADVRCHESFLKCKECRRRLVHETKPEWLATGTLFSESEETTPRETLHWGVA